MGLYLPKIDMPKSCYDCNLWVVMDCTVTDDYAEVQNPDCPLIHLGDHGTLIDQDVLRRKILDSMEDNPHTDKTVASNHAHEHVHFFDMVSKMPEIIPAETNKYDWIFR